MDAERFKNEFLPFHRKLYGIAYRLLENESDAEDLVQEAYLKLWSKREGLSAVSNPEAFSVTLVKNMCLDILRSGKNVLNRQTQELTEGMGGTVSDDYLELKEDVRQVKKIISSLPEQQQKVVVLRDIKECTYEEIEQITGLNAINVRVLLSRGRKKIREQFHKLNGYENRGN